MKNAKHYQNNNDDARTHGVGAGRPAVVVEHDDFDGGKVHGGRHQEYHRADCCHGTHEKIDKILNESHPRQGKDDLEKVHRVISEAAKMYDELVREREDLKKKLRDRDPNFDLSQEISRINTKLGFSIWFLGGVQCMLIGIVGEYMGRTYVESRQRPLYFVRERLGITPPSGSQEKTSDSDEATE